MGGRFATVAGCSFAESFAHSTPGSWHADDQPVSPQAAGAAAEPAEAPGGAGLSPEAGRVPAGENDDAQEAELGAAQGGARAAVERDRGDGLHPGRGAQPSGALDRA